MQNFAQPPFWAARYIGIPFVDLGRSHDGCDCWGLVRLVLQEQARVQLPSLDTTYVSEREHERVICEIESQKNGDRWYAVNPGDERTFDVVEMSAPIKVRGRWAFPSLHVGVLVCSEWVLHVERATASRLSSMSEKTIASRVLGIWRYQES